MLEYKRQLRRAYADAFKDSALQPCYLNFGKRLSNAWLNELIVPHAIRDEVLMALDVRDIMARPMFTPLHTQAPYRGFACTAAEAERSMARFGSSILLPSGRLEP